MPYKEPYSEGWEDLSVEERIEHWLAANKGRIDDEERAEYIQSFLENFSISYEQLDRSTLQQLIYELTAPMSRFWTPEEKRLLWDGVFAMYNTTPGLLGLKLVNDAREGYKLN